ncbi:MAG: HAMP domain-containing sensor histidine kinase [Patescibacteria group bacterium]|jgi:signal transduction histidine kinase
MKSLSLYLARLKRFFNRKFTQMTKLPTLVEDESRQKTILDILVFLSIAAFVVINIIRIIDYINNKQRGLPLWTTMLILFFLFFLAILSQYKAIRAASILLIFLYSLPMIFSLAIWGADLPAGLLLAVLIIIISVALLGARAAFFVTFIISALLLSLTSLQNQKIIAIQNYWRQENNQIADAIVYSVLLLVIAGITWLFAHGIHKSLARARNSEKALEEERNSLEKKVGERTKELRRAEQDKINQLYRLAEFGRLSSGIFHDLVNPLTAVSLNLEQIKGETENKNASDKDIANAKSHLNQALLAANKMEGLITGIKKQLQKESALTAFDPNKEITEIIQILAYKARRANVKINFSETKNLIFIGDAVKFGQIIINLLANAIDASENSQETQKIEISLKKEDAGISIIVEDQGTGIAPENIDRIFERYFSTKKKTGQGLGIGLSLARDIIEKTFNGTISVASQFGAGSSFTVFLPFKIIKNDINEN